MPPTPPGPLARSNYLGWPPGTYQPEADPNNPAFDPAVVLPATGAGPQALDAEQYYRPLERLHGAGLHGPGVAYGLAVTVTAGHPDVTVGPGLALDPAGRHIYLSVGGSAEIGPSADVPDTPPNPVPVAATGAVLPTAGLAAGTYYVIVQWRETWSAQGSGSNPNIDFYTDTPWLRLLGAQDYQPDLQVILGEVVLVVAGGATVVQSASYGEAGKPQRTSVSLPAQALNLRRAVTTTAPPGADSVSWGAVRAREAGGVEIAVAKAADQVALVNDTGGTFAGLSVAVGQATFGDPANPGVSVNAAEATVRVGTHGQRGEIIVHDIANHAAITLAGDSGHVVVGGTTMNGQVRMLNNSGTDTMRLDGGTGAAVVQRVAAFDGATVHVDTGRLWVHAADFALDGRTGRQNRALVDEGDLLVINFNGDYHNGVRVDGALSAGEVTLSGLTAANGSSLDVTTFTLGAHASDFVLDGRSQKGNRALVDEGDLLVINFNGDYGQGVRMDGNITISSPVDTEGVLMLGSPVRKVQVATLHAHPGSTVATMDIDLGQQRVFTAYTFVRYVQVLTGNNAAGVAEIYQVDNQPMNVWNTGGPLGDVYQPWLGTWTGQHVFFRARSTPDNISIHATIVVFYE